MARKTRTIVSSQLVGTPQNTGGNSSGGTDYASQLRDLIARLQGQTSDLAAEQRSLQQQALDFQEQEAARQRQERVLAENVNRQAQSETYVNLLQNLILAG